MTAWTGHKFRRHCLTQAQEEVRGKESGESRGHASSDQGVSMATHKKVNTTATKQLPLLRPPAFFCF